MVEAGETITAHSIKLDIRKLLPGEFHSFTIRVPIGDLKNGRYTIGMAILDPMTGQPAIKFANANPRGDLIQVMGSFELLRLLARD